MRATVEPECLLRDFCACELLPEPVLTRAARISRPSDFLRSQRSTESSPSDLQRGQRFTRGLYISLLFNQNNVRRASQTNLHIIPTVTPPQPLPYIREAAPDRPPSYSVIRNLKPCYRGQKPNYSLNRSRELPFGRPPPAYSTTFVTNSEIGVTQISLQPDDITRADALIIRSADNMISPPPTYSRYSY